MKSKMRTFALSISRSASFLFFFFFLISLLFRSHDIFFCFGKILISAIRSKNKRFCHY